MPNPDAPPPGTTDPGIVPDLNLGSSSGNDLGQQIQSQQSTNRLGQPKQQVNQPPQMSGAPLLARVLQTAFKGGGFDPAVGDQPARPVSRLDRFEGFLGEFLNSFATGLQGSGTGPGAFGRGMGGAIQAPYQRQLQGYQLQQQQQQLESQRQLQQAETERTRAQAQGTTITLPNGQVATLPAEYAKSILQAQVAGQAKVQAAGVQKQFLSTPFGIYDTKAQKYVEGGMKGVVTVTPEMQQDMKLPQEVVGTKQKITDLSSWMRGEASTMTAVQGAAGPALGSKLQGPGSFKDLGLGSPAANAIAQGKLSLAQKQFERDTFGTLMGKSIPSSLVDESGNTIGWKSPAAPTSSIKTQAQQASDLSQLFTKVQSKLAEANKAGKLGPYEGRLNELMTGKIGADDPLFAEVRALGSLTASGMLKAHFGARGGQQMYDHFEALFNTGKMTYGDLIGAMRGFSTFMDQYASRVRTAGGGGGGTTNQKFSPNNPFAPKTK